ncbi:hypothetical protein BGY98DRAFT_1013622, partial [Russula aff. rugulosa BPL654]
HNSPTLSAPASNPQDNDIAFRVVDAQVDQGDHDILSRMRSARTSSRFIDSSVVFDAMLSTGGVVGANRVERESGSSSSMENACVIAIESFG